MITWIVSCVPIIFVNFAERVEDWGHHSAQQMTVFVFDFFRKSARIATGIVVRLFWGVETLQKTGVRLPYNDVVLNFLGWGDSNVCSGLKA